MNEKHTINLLMGERPCRYYDDIDECRKVLKKDGDVKQFTFNTQAEVSAFLLGLEEGRGWEDVLILTDEEYAALTKKD